MVETPYLAELTRGLELRWRVRIFIRHLATTLIVSAGASLLAALINATTWLTLPVGRIILLANGAAVAVALVLAAIRRRTPSRLLLDADAAYRTKTLLSSAAEFAWAENGAAPGTARRAGATPGGTHAPGPADLTDGFKSVIIRQAEEASRGVDPATVYPVSLPRRSSVVAALAAALVIMLLLQASGWFARPTVELTQEGFLLEDVGRQLAQRDQNEELSELADEIRRLGERLRDGDMDAEEARRRIEQLAERVEEQVRNLERLGEFDTNQEMEIPPDVEDSVRSALRSGMTEGEVLDFFMGAQAEGDTIPDALRSLEEATGDRPPDANLPLDDERVRELLDQLNISPDPDAEGGLAEDLENVRRSLEQAGAGVQELTEGDDEQFGDPGQANAPVRGGSEDPDQSGASGPGMEEEGASGQQGGDKAVADAMDDTFTRIEDANPIFRQIEGVVGDGTIRDVIIRELPSEAVSLMDESEREVAFERVIEEAVGRDNTPPELQHLVRNYFLRITLGDDQGEDDEQ